MTSPPADGERDLRELLAGMKPALDRARYRFVVRTDPAALAAEADRALMLFREAEGTTLILPVADDEAPPADVPIFRRITLTVHSSLEAVGLTAAVADALTRAGISANIVAAYYHDHVFVPVADAEAALRALRRLSAEA